jgi:hypothetical protein
MGIQGWNAVPSLSRGWRRICPSDTLAVMPPLLLAWIGGPLFSKIKHALGMGATGQARASYPSLFVDPITGLLGDMTIVMTVLYLPVAMVYAGFSGKGTRRVVAFRRWCTISLVCTFLFMGIALREIVRTATKIVEQKPNMPDMPKGRLYEILFGIGAYGALFFVLGVFLIVILYEKETPAPEPDKGIVDLIDRIMRQAMGLVVGFFVLAFLAGQVIQS